MIVHRKKVAGGSGLINSLINKLPVELHIPGYNYCGPGTKLEKRLSRGDSGVNGLDEACKEHDIAYSQNTNLKERHSADKVLADKAFKRFRSKNASISEKLAALGVTTAMNAKVKMGAGHKRKRKQLKKKKILTFKDGVKRVRLGLNSNNSIDKNVEIALRSFRKIKRKFRTPRIIPIPKRGGLLPLIPIFAGLSALGALAGGASGIVKAVNESRAAKDQLAESQRHNKTLEAITLGKGLYLQKHKNGLGLYLTPNPILKKKNFQ